MWINFPLWPVSGVRLTLKEGEVAEGLSKVPCKRHCQSPALEDGLRCPYSVLVCRHMLFSWGAEEVALA